MLIYLHATNQHPRLNHLGEINQKPKKGIFTLSHLCVAVKASGFRRLWRSVQAQLAVVNTYSPIIDFSLSSWIPSRLMFYGHSYFDPTRNMQAMFYLIFFGKLIFGNVSAFNGYIHSRLDHPWSHLGETQKLVGMQCCLTRPCGLGQRRHYYGPQ